LRQSYDYVVIVPQCRCVLAIGLTENPDVTVCCWRRGGQDDADEIPFRSLLGVVQTKWDWNYETGEQKHLAAGPRTGQG